MMQRGNWFTRLSDTAKGATVILSLVVTVATASWAAYGYVGEQAQIPRRVRDLETVTTRHSAQIDSIRTDGRDTRRMIERVLCLQEFQADLRPITECIR